MAEKEYSFNKLDVIKTYDDETLLRFANDVLRKIGTGGFSAKDFQKEYGTNYSFSDMVNEMRGRGYMPVEFSSGAKFVNRARIVGSSPLKTIEYGSTEYYEKVASYDCNQAEERMNVTMGANVKKHFQEFRKFYGGSVAMHVTIALERYMDAVEKGEIIPEAIRVCSDMRQVNELIEKLIED